MPVLKVSPFAAGELFAQILSSAQSGFPVAISRIMRLIAVFPSIFLHPTFGSLSGCRLLLLLMSIDF